MCTCICTYSRTSLVSTPGDPPNCHSLSVILANHIRRLVLWVIGWGIISLYFLTRYYSLTVFLLPRFYCMCMYRYIRMYVCMYIFTCWFGYEETFVVRICTYIRTYVYIHMYIHVYMFSCPHHCRLFVCRLSLYWYVRISHCSGLC